MKDDLVTQLVSKPPRDSVPLDILLVNREGLMGNVKVGGHLVHSDNKLVEFVILGKVRRGISRTATLGFQRADFGLLRRLTRGVP